MNNNVEIINLDSDLRRHLLFGFIGLVIAVLVVFVFVTRNIANELAISIESSHIQAKLDEISAELNRYSLTDKNTLNKQKLNEYFANSRYLLEDDIVFFKIAFTELNFLFSQEKTFPAISDLAATIALKESNKGVDKFNGDSFFWFYEFNQTSRYELILVRKVSAFDLAISAMTTRLSISAFVTFWLAVWAALIISALITKRFIKGNIRLNYLANHDTLTNLPNRSYLYEVVNKFLQYSEDKKQGETPQKAVMLFIDLNKFKSINDTLGHHIGDLLLSKIATRLKKFVTDDTYAFRYGGDEFIIWSENKDQVDGEKLAQEVIDACRELLTIRGSQFEMTVSIGIACYPKDGKNFNDLFKRADIAMYQAKHMRLGYQSYHEQLDLHSALKLNLSGQLNHALINQQFVLFYQPKVDIKTGKVFGLEALVRWQHPTEGLLGSDLFITLIEQSNFVHTFTRYVIKQALLQCKQWLDEGLYLSVAINISPYNLLDNGLVAFLKEELNTHKVPPQLIEIELTESATMVDINATQKVFKQFRELGVKLSIDDFGTGMSSLSYIKKLAVDFIKIDRAFIINIDKDIEDEAIVMSLLLLCKKLNRQVVIEGVETQEQRDKLIELGCEFAQGFYFGKPLPAKDLSLK